MNQIITMIYLWILEIMDRLLRRKKLLSSITLNLVACSSNTFLCKLKFLFIRDLNRGCLVYMFSLRFSGSNFLINLRRQFRVRKIFCTQVFAGFAVFSFRV